MKVSYNWLKDYCEFDLRAHELADKLSHAGLNVDTCEPMGADYSLDVEVTANRPDCLSHMGMAREIAAAVGSSPRRPAVEFDEDVSAPAAAFVSVRIDDTELCPHYTARVVRGVRIGPSPDWMQARLAACGVRPVNNVVDITNYVMLECGQPLHAFDLSLVGGAEIIVRPSFAGETITLIDATELELTGAECVIADARKPVALAGIMGGLESEIGDSTTDVLLEAARFQPKNIRRSCRRFGIGSDSSYRFERGIDPEITDWASRRACQLMAELAGGKVAAGVVAVRADETPALEVTLRLPRLEGVLGIEVPRAEVLKIFRGMDLDVLHDSGDELTVRVPSWRGDVEREVDLIEEVARVYGYDKIRETTDMQVNPTQAGLDELAARRTRRLISGHGFCEVMTYSLVADDPIQRCQPWHDGDPVRISNPVSKERVQMRLTCMANMLQAKRFNQAHSVPEVDLYELQPIYLPREGSEQPHEKLVLCMLTDRPEGLRVLKGVLANIVDELGLDVRIEEKPGGKGPFEPGTSVDLSVGGRLLGCGGVVSDEAADQFDLRSRPALMELDYGMLAEGARFDLPYRPVPAYPAIERDLAVIVSEDTLWTDIERHVRESAPDILESVSFVDLYRGDPVPKGHKSVAFAMTFRKPDGTLTAGEADESVGQVLQGLQKALGARLR